MDQEANYEKQVIKVYRTPPEGQRGTEIAVVRWIKDGRAFAPQLINQEVYYSKAGGAQAVERKFGKMKGWKVADMAVVAANLEEITELLEDIPGGRTKKAPGAGKAAASGDVKAPWDE